MPPKVGYQAVLYYHSRLQKQASGLHIARPRVQPSRLNLPVFIPLRTSESHYSTLNMDIPLLTLHDGNKIPLVSFRVTEIL